jgi:hypothetical protein
LFRNGEAWSESKQFGRDDLPIVSKVADLAHTWIFSQSHGNSYQREDSDK